MTPIESAKTISALQVAERYARVQAVRKGRRWWACCVLHKEHTPSLMFDEQGRFHCFGCGASGTSIDFVMALNGISAGDAARQITSDFGLKPDSEYHPRSSQTSDALIKKAFTQYDTIAAGYLRYLQENICLNSDLEADDFSDSFAMLLMEREKMLKVCETMFSGTDEERLALLVQYQQEAAQWEQSIRKHATNE